ncbi:Tripartite-type tricarboxylate transporter, receptor component TctC [Enhydrobacter aerosaccus]|uniref:Tripartite-type tricarboxylate transporter, receptor component TctC n=1 Tax=Enhydrobacter aerosaccus TaxID=225324 RepID=A0A1T4NID1_9HYPH|nr:tripartite tricarboxylate transporter substrate binding protein [Enhydrobacter aerosaccus]SJZ78806.1 Tripartite-type tricarboxylate transporter, receptor component TctC [Enhydrobacter aerosaccus]
MPIRRRNFTAGAGALFAAGRAAAAFADTFPSKPIRWIIPFAAAGNYDVTSRIVGEAMGRLLNQTIVMDNRPGAGGLVGVETAINAPADGYTVVMASFSVLFVSPLMAGKPSLLSAVAPVSLLTTVPMVVVGRPGGRFADMQAVLAAAKAKPGTVTIGHAGNGTSNHVDILRLQVSEKITFNIIPYKGSGPGLADLMGGNIDLYMDQLSTSLPHIKNGKLKAMVAVSPERLPSLPDVPCLKDIGATPFDGGTTAGLFVREGTPTALIATLNQNVTSALKDDAVRARLAELGAITRPSTPEAFAAALKSDEETVTPLVKSGLLKPE